MSILTEKHKCARCDTEQTIGQMEYKSCHKCKKIFPISAAEFGKWADAYDKSQATKEEA